MRTEYNSSKKSLFKLNLLQIICFIPTERAQKKEFFLVLQCDAYSLKKKHTFFPVFFLLFLCERRSLLRCAVGNAILILCISMVRFIARRKSYAPFCNILVLMPPTWSVEKKRNSFYDNIKQIIQLKTSSITTLIKSFICSTKRF